MEGRPRKPELVFFGISIKTFGVTFALGFLACGLVIARRLRELESPSTGPMRSSSPRCSAASSARAATS